MQEMFEAEITFVSEITFIEPALPTEKILNAPFRNIIMLTTGE